MGQFYARNSKVTLLFTTQSNLFSTEEKIPSKTEEKGPLSFDCKINIIEIFCLILCRCYRIARYLFRNPPRQRRKFNVLQRPVGWIYK